MFGLEINLKSTRPRSDNYETKTETRDRDRDRDPENWSRDLYHW